MANLPEAQTQTEAQTQKYVPVEGAPDPVVWQKVISPAAGMVLKMYAGQNIPRLSDLLNAKELVEWRLAEIQGLLDEGNINLGQIDEAELMNLQESSVEFAKYIARPDVVHEVAGYLVEPEQTSEPASAEAIDRHLKAVA